jgi:hypothetical protein
MMGNSSLSGQRVLRDLLLYKKKSKDIPAQECRDGHYNIMWIPSYASITGSIKYTVSICEDTRKLSF